MDRRTFIRASAAGAAFASLKATATPEGSSAVSDRPNILFLFTDDQRFDTIRALGNPDIITPNMDRLVERGAAFTHACIMGGTHGAVCQPSRAMLMTGRTQFRAPNDIGDFVTFPELLRTHGYRTFGTGKWHNGPASYAKSFSDGATIFYGGMSNHLEVPIHDFAPDGRYPREAMRVGKEFSSEMFSNSAVDFLQGYDDDAPFCMYVSYTAPHDPRMAPKEFADLYDPARLPLPTNFMPEHPFDNGEMRIRDEALAPWPRTPEIVREHLAAYYGMITHLDHHIGRVLQALEVSGRAENTIIVLAGDNGLAVGQHGLLGKQNLYDHSIRVPLVLAGPGIPQGARREALCYLLDIFPTLCDLTGLAIPETVEGHSLMPLVSGERTRDRETMFYAYRDIHRAVRDDHRKLIEYYVDDARTTQLFDLDQDPWETTSLAGHPQHADDVRRLRAELTRWQYELDDPMVG